MAENKNDETVKVVGRSGERARALLDIAVELGHHKNVVKATVGGYVVPADVADAYEGRAAEPAAEPKAQEQAEAATEPEGLPVSEESTHDEIDAYAKTVGVEFPSNKNKAEKIEILTAQAAEKNKE